MACFTDQTVAETSQAASCLSICEDSKELLPDQFYFLVIDGLARELGLSAADISAIPAADLAAAIEAAECSLGALRSYTSITDKKAQQIILYLLCELIGP